MAALWWIDTRDMHADGLTKGTVDRQALQAIMAGTVKYDHEAQVWKPKKTTISRPGIDLEPETAHIAVLRL